MKNPLFFLFGIVFFLSIHPLFAYDPLTLPEQPNGETLEFTIHDETRKREIPILVYLPSEKKTYPVVLFSHGLGGSRENSVYLAKHWTSRGYVSVFLQHIGSDTSVWKGVPLGQRMASMRKAADLENFLLRVKDVSVVLDQLEQWNQSETHAIFQRLDMTRIGMSGHSFGAVTTQAVSGQSFPKNKSFLDSRIKAALAFSPSSSRHVDPKESFGSVKIPWMLMTGTKDVSIIGDADVESRLAVFPALPSGGKYEVLLYDAEHSAFSDRSLPGDKQQRNPNHHRVILALSTAFWDTWLHEDSSAKAWLEGEGPASVLEKNDRWQKK